MKRIIANFSLLIIMSQLCFSKSISVPTGESKPVSTIFVRPNTNKWLLYQTDTSKIAASRLILPGKSIGKTVINQKMSVVFKKLGNPSSSDASMGGHTMCTWYSKPKIKGNDTIINETNIYFYTKNFGEANAVALVDHIRVTSPYFKTSIHIGVGTNLEKIQNKYPAAILQSSDSDPKNGKIIDNYYDEKKGIAFDIMDRKCVAITVYRIEN